MFYFQDWQLSFSSSVILMNEILYGKYSIVSVTAISMFSVGLMKLLKRGHLILESDTVWVVFYTARAKKIMTN